MVEGKVFEGGEIQGEKVRGEQKGVHSVGTLIQNTLEIKQRGS